MKKEFNFKCFPWFQRTAERRRGKEKGREERSGAVSGGKEGESFLF